MVSFNVLDDAWIPALDKQGQVKEYGLLELLEKSSELQKIKDPSPLFQYGIYRLLITFITDVYRPEALEDIGDLLRQGCFDMERINNYLADEHNRFDLFDPENPFLQVKADPKYETEKTVKSVANLLHEIPTGNNDLLFVHELEKEHSISPEVCAKALCAIGLFSTAGVQGYPSGVNGAPPWFVLVRGQTLFETLVFNTWVPSLELPYYDDNVIWRSKRVIEPKQEIGEISYVAGLMWPTRRISLIAEIGGHCTYTGKQSEILVRNIYYQQGLNFNGYNLWKDPHTSGYANTEGRGTLKPRPMKSLWRDIGPMLLLQSYQGKKYQVYRPPVINQYYELEKNRYIQARQEISIEAYGLATDNAKFLTWHYGILSTIAVIGELGEEGQRIAQFIQSCLEKAEEVGNLLKGVVKKIYTDRQKGKTMDSLVDRTESIYWTELRGKFFNEFIPLVADEASNASADWQEKPLKLWENQLKINANRNLDYALDQMGNHADVLRKSVVARGKLNGGLKKILMGEEVKKS